MTEPYWALAAGCVPDAQPWDIPVIAHQAGFLTCGMWIDPATTWDSGALARTTQALNDTGVRLVDVEALWLADADSPTDTHKLTVDAGQSMGARNVLVVCRHDNLDAAVSQFRGICEHAEGSDLRINLEFGEFTTVRSLAAALEFVTDVDHPKAGILIDLMHINRSGDELPALDADIYSYVQACDFYQSSATMTGADYIEAAVDARCPLGEGEARVGDIQAVCEAEIDVSLEIRSKALRDEFPDPVERATQIFRRCDRRKFAQP